ncbi:STAS domain-containing protein [Catellatospora vulcania]|uniref:STAS domain-containing protein n=1 Tax=Catellatospora vulcania TaxID=1460450 RepID=UPI0012D4738B|nr:STAS domain-containing protein [Catellatospora vulcania]
MTRPHITTDVDDNGVAILGVSGGIGTGAELTAAIAAVLDTHRVTQLVIDLVRVSSLAPAGLEALLGGRATALRSGAAFRVIRPQHPVRQILDATGTCQLLTRGQAAAPEPAGRCTTAASPPGSRTAAPPGAGSPEPGRAAGVAKSLRPADASPRLAVSTGGALLAGRQEQP